MDAPQSILVLHHGGAQLRGSERVLVGLLANLPPAQLRAIVAAQGEALRAPLGAHGIDVVGVDLAELVISNTETRLPIGRFVRTFARLRKLARANDVRLVLANGGAPCQVGVPLAASLGVPLVCLMHHPAQRKFQFFWLTRFVRTMVYVSEHTAARTRQLIGDGGEVVHAGIDVRALSPATAPDHTLRRELGIPDSAVVFGQVGALVAYKGHRTLVEAFATLLREVPDAWLVLIGDGPERAALEQLSREHGIASKVTFAGYVGDVLPFLQHVIDINVLPSAEEGLGLVTLEAAACAVPTIGSDATGIRETIIHEKTGLLVEPGSAPALSAGMRVIAREPARRRAMGAAAREHVMRHFSAEDFGKRLSAIMEEAIAERRGAVAFTRSQRWPGARPAAQPGASALSGAEAGRG